MSMSSGASTNGVRLGAIGEAWAVVQKNMGTWIVTTLIYIVMMGVIIALLGRMSAQSRIMGVVVSLLIAVVGGFFMGGALRMAFKQLRGEATSPGDLFNAGDIAPMTVGTNVLQQLPTIICQLIVPLLSLLVGIIVAPLVLLALPIAVAQKSAPVDSIMRSFNLLSKNWVSSFVLCLVLGLILIVSLIPCGLGIFVTWPLIVVTLAIVYNDFFGGSPAVADNSSLYPPIPNIPQ